MISAARRPLIGVADPQVARQLAQHIEQFAAAPPAIASSLERLRELSSRIWPPVILLDDELLGGMRFAELLRYFTATAPVILLAPLERQTEVARLVAEGELEFVARAGDFIPLAAALVERRLRWASTPESLLGPQWAELAEDAGAIFRHEINNPLTGILGNAEMLLAHRERLSSVDTQRLETVVGLAVRLRETVRRLSNDWDAQPNSLKSA
ncbi:MAG: histidine kinase dimerization/phospho-acceptor domain-containing protein [Candidatus Acidiferrales bacterium]